MPENSALDLKAMQEQNRAALMDAITRRNDLHVEVERLEQRRITLEREATEALRDGNRGTAKLRLQAKVAADQELQTRRGELAGVETSVEEVKRSIRDLEDLLKMQPPEAPKPPVASASVSTEETPPFPNDLSDTLDTLASGDHGQPLATDTAVAPSNASSISGNGQKGNAQTPDLTALSSALLTPVPSEEPSPEADDILIARAQERGLTTKAYAELVEQRLLELSNMLMPAAAPISVLTEDTQSLLVEEVVNEAMLELQASEKASSDYVGRATKQKINLTRHIANETRLRTEAEQSARDALNKENRELAQQMYRRMRLHDAALNVLQPMLAQAEAQMEQAQRQIRQQGARVRLRLVKTMLLRAHLANAALAFQQDTLPAETARPETEDDDFDAWVHAHRPGSPE